MKLVGQTCTPYTRLVYLPVERKWAFKVESELMQFAEEPLFYETRSLAIEGARRAGYTVDRHGCVQFGPVWIPRW